MPPCADFAFRRGAGACLVGRIQPPGVTSGTANDYGAVNQGQLKNIATAAYQQMQANLPGGAGAEVTALISQWSTVNPDGSRTETSGSNTNDYAAVNLEALQIRFLAVFSG